MKKRTESNEKSEERVLLHRFYPICESLKNLKAMHLEIERQFLIHC